MKSTQVLAILKSKIQKGNIPNKESYVAAINEAMKSLRKCYVFETIIALIIGSSITMGLVIIYYLTYLIK